MAKASVEQHAFNAGELSPLVSARFDVDRFAYGARTMENFIPTLQGPARKRPGFRFVDDLGERRLLKEVVFSQTDAWILAFGDATLGFYSDDGPVLEAAKTITDVTAASPGVVTSNSHGFSNGDRVYIEDVGGTTELNGRVFTVASVATNTFELVDMWGTSVDTSSLGAYTSGGTASRLYEIVSPYAIADLFDDNGCSLMSSVQSEDVIYICVPGYQPRKLTRSSSTSWAFSTLDQTGGPFMATDPDETVTVYASAASGSGVTLTASSAIFTADHVGALFYLAKKLDDALASWEAGKTISSIGASRRYSGNYYQSLTTGTTGSIAPTHTEGSRYDGDSGVQWEYQDSGYGWCKITAIGGGGTTATVDVLSQFNENSVGAGNPSTQWAFGAWSEDQGWPTHTFFFRQRQGFARGTKIWMSVPDDFESFKEQLFGVVTDDSAISIDIRIGQNDSIQWISPASDLLVGTDGNEFSIGEISSSSPLSPSNIASLRGPGYGSRRVQPARVNEGVMYAMPAGRVIRELRYDFSVNGYVALNKTAFSEHITRGAINFFSFAKEPESIVWASCADGRLLGMSFEREHQLLAWHKHVLGGSYSDGNPVVDSIATIPSPAGDRDELYCSVKRTINGVTKYYLEYLSAHWDETVDDLADMTYSDSCLSTSSNTSTTISGLEHLIGETVVALGDGRYLGEYTVSASGSITLASSSAPAVVTVGLPYTATLESMNLARPDRLTGYRQIFLRFLSSVYAKLSGSWTNDRNVNSTWAARDVDFNYSGRDVSAPMPAQTRVIKSSWEGDHGREMYVSLTHDKPTACTLAGWAFDTSQGDY